MKGVQLTAIGDLRLKTLEQPQAEPGERLLKVSHCALCRTDAKLLAHGHRDLVLPRIPGHEICATDPETGERFAVWPGAVCGDCPYCRSSAENLCEQMRITGFHRDGGLAQWVAVPKQSLIPVPPELPDALACLAEPLGCTVNALEGLRVQGNESVLILGAGPVGLMAGLAARSRGAVPVFAERHPEKRETVAPIVRAMDGQWHESGNLYDAGLNAAPGCQTVVEGIQALKAGGRFSLFSGLTDAALPGPEWFNRIHYRQLSVSGAYGLTRAQMKTALQILAAHAQAASLLIESPVSLESVPRLLAKLLDEPRLSLKCVVRL